MLVKLLIASLVGLILLFILLVWLVADLLHLSLLLPISVTAFFVFGALSIVLYRRMKASGAADGLERELAKQAKEQAKLVRPDLQGEIENMQGEFDKAVSALKSAKLGPGGRGALYFLPWYAIIGPPGAGKSTALRNSGLNFPYTSGSGDPKVRGLGGTRNCDWWLTNEAVILDTAGRWATQDEDHDEWLSFLGLLKRYRARKPLNGLIAAISVQELVNAREDEVESLAQSMRARLDEVQTQLRISLPVYVLFTKTDLVEGFLETFGDLRKNERGQVWGFTMPLSERVPDLGAAFSARFDELVQVLEKRSLARMADDRSIERRAMIYAFPQQFTALRRNMQRFIHVMFEKNVYKTTPVLRGAYFTSGTQEGRPFNLLVNRLVEAMGIKRDSEAIESAVDQKSYFLHDLFMKVIFEDRDIASASQAELRRERMQRWVITGVLGVVALVIGLIPGSSWSRNKYLLTRIELAIDEWEGPAKQKMDQAHKLEALEPLRERVNTLVAYEKSGPPLGMRMGMYQANDLVTPLRHYYANLLRRELVQPVVSHDLQRMADFGLRYATMPRSKPQEQELNLFYDLLKLHLLLTQPKQPSEPPLPGAPIDWVKSELQGRWADPEKATKEQLEAARVNAELYTGTLLELPDLSFPRDSEVVKRVRDALNRVPPTMRALNRLIGLAEQDGGYTITVSTLIGSSIAFEEGGKVRSAFTRRGFENVVRDALSTQILEDAGELWVLGLVDGKQPEVAQREVQLEELRSLYFRAYIEEWQNFLRTVRTREARGPSDSLELVRELTRGVPPLQQLFIQKVYYNTILKPKETVSSLAGKAADSIVDNIRGRLENVVGQKNSDKAAGRARALTARADHPDRVNEASVAAAFAPYCSFGVAAQAEGDTSPPPPVPFGVYREQLELVRDALQQYADNRSELDQVNQKVKTATSRTKTVIDQQVGSARQYLQQLLFPPISSAKRDVEVTVASTGSDAWCNDIVAEYARSLAGRYPFNRDGQDVAFADFNNFYRPKTGRLWTFVEGSMSKMVQLDGDKYVFAGSLGEDGKGMYNRDLLEFLDRSRDITQSFFPSGSSEPSSEFEVLVHPSPEVARTSFTVGGTMVEHFNGPEQWKTLVWPGKDPAAGASIVIRGANGMQERIKQDGPWGLMRLLEAGSLQREAGRTFTVAWQLQTHDVTLRVDFRPKRGESPFLGVPGHSKGAVMLQPVRNRAAVVPRHIAQGMGCKS
jgi:type VI secretion system protein ImpL